MSNFCLPDLGEGLQDARVVAWQVSVGQRVRTGEPMLSVETAKAIVDIPAPFDARVEKLCVKVEDVVAVGETLLLLEQPNDRQVPENIAASHAESIDTDTDTGTDTDDTELQREDSATSLGIVGTVSTAAHKVAQRTSTKQEKRAAGTSESVEDDVHAVKVMPGVRAKAHEHGISLDKIAGTGPGGSISNKDLDDQLTDRSGPAKALSTLAADLSQTESTLQNCENQEQIRQSLRHRMTSVMRQSANTVVSATVCEVADIHLQPEDCDLTVLALQAIVSAVAREPVLNAWFSHKDASLDVREEINIGIAVDTSMGLLVPVLHDADKLNAKGLRDALDNLMDTVRAGDLQPAQMTGATIALSNFGSIGGMHAHLVVAPPTVAIVGIGRARDLVVSKDGAIVVHPSLPVSLTFDHCAITGGEATRFLNGLTDVFENSAATKFQEKGDD